MAVNIVPLMRMSLWFLLVAAGFIALFWLVLVVVSGFTIWTIDSNVAGLTLQAGLVLSPVALFLGLKLSKHSADLTTALFASSWCVVFAALVTVDLL